MGTHGTSWVLTGSCCLPFAHPSPAQSHWLSWVSQATADLRTLVWSCPLLGVPFPLSLLFPCFPGGCPNPFLRESPPILHPDAQHPLSFSYSHPQIQELSMALPKT